MKLVGPLAPEAEGLYHARHKQLLYWPSSATGTNVPPYSKFVRGRISRHDIVYYCTSGNGIMTQRAPEPIQAINSIRMRRRVEVNAEGDLCCNKSREIRIASVYLSEGTAREKRLRRYGSWKKCELCG